MMLLEAVGAASHAGLMIGAVTVMASVPMAGLTISRLLWKRLDPSAELSCLESAVSAIVCGLAAWLGVAWTLAVMGSLSTLSILAVASAFVALALGSVRLPTRYPQWRNLLSYAPIAGWLAYVLGRAPFLPPLNHDALSYHFTRAVLMARTQGFARFGLPDNRIDNYPANYELLLSQMLLGGRSDLLTEWISTTAFVALLVTAAAMADRWWPDRGSTAAAVLAVAAAPVVLLASGADKNDLLATFFSTSALLWTGRWFSERGQAPMLLAIVSLALGIGVKPTVIFVAGGTLIPIAAGALRHPPSVTGVVRTLAASVACFLCLGGVPYLANVMHMGGTTGAAMHQEISRGIWVGYGEWQNLWRIPYLVLTAPFSASQDGVWLPWLSERWFWPRYEVFFSNFGQHISLLALLLPVAIRSSLSAHRHKERILVSSAAAFGFLSMLPLEMRPAGFIATFPRLSMFIVPVLAALTLPPLLVHAGRLHRLLTAALAIVATVNAVDCAVNDRFVPLEYVKAAVASGGTRNVYFRPERAGNVLDRIAGPDDCVAFLGGFDAWSYPLFGTGLSRAVLFLNENATSRDIAPEVQWIVIDRGWSAVWGHPDLQESGQVAGRIGAGPLSPDDSRLVTELLADPGFAVVYRDIEMNQVVFRRVHSP